MQIVKKKKKVFHNIFIFSLNMDFDYERNREINIAFKVHIT